MKSRVISKLDSFAKRISPPGTADCSGSQNFAVPVTVIVVRVATAPAEPMASSARLTRNWGSWGDGVVAQEPRTTDNSTAVRMRVITLPLFLNRIKIPRPPARASSIPPPRRTLAAPLLDAQAGLTDQPRPLGGFRAQV